MKTENLIVEELNSDELIDINGGSEFSEAVVGALGGFLRSAYEISKSMRANSSYGNANVYK